LRKTVVAKFTARPDFHHFSFAILIDIFGVLRGWRLGRLNTRRLSHRWRMGCGIGPSLFGLSFGLRGFDVLHLFIQRFAIA
jgi:hypothetical protein